MSTSGLDHTITSAVTLLGGAGLLHTRPRILMDWIPIVRNGLPATSLDSLVGLTQIARSELASALAISERTLARRRRAGVLSPEESAKLVRLAQVIERADEVFQNTDIALTWLKTNNPALGGVTPLSLMDTGIGADAVLDTLGRIEHGVFA